MPAVLMLPPFDFLTLRDGSGILIKCFDGGVCCDGMLCNVW